MAQSPSNTLASNTYWSHNVPKLERLPWYQKELPEIKPESRELFENYSKLAPEDVAPHILKMRDAGFKVFPYPCLGSWGFLNFNISKSSCYNEIIQRTKDGQKFIDIGCCVGQDIRKLVHDGAPSENTYGSDLKKEFMDVGYELFLDSSSLKTQFIAADILDADSDLKQLDRQMDIVYVSHFFHLFNWNDQVQAAKRLVALLKPNAGGLIVGRHTGHSVAAETQPKFEMDIPKYRHNVESFIRMWEQVGNETDTKWDFDVTFVDDQPEKEKSSSKFMPEGTRTIGFAMRRL